MSKPNSKQPVYNPCVECGAVLVVMGGPNPKSYLVDKGVCIKCVAEVVGRYSAESSYKRLQPDQDGPKRRRRKSKKTNK